MYVYYILVKIFRIILLSAVTISQSLLVPVSVNNDVFHQHHKDVKLDFKKAIIKKKKNFRKY